MAQFNITVNLDWLDEEENLDERLRDEILSGVASKVGDNITKSLESEAKKLLDKRMVDLEGEISQKLNTLMQDFFDTPRDVTDDWGKVKRKQVTVTQLLSEACDNFLKQPLDKNGMPYNGYSPDFKTRIDYIVHNAIDSNMKWAIERAVKDVTDKLQKRISTEIKEQMGEKLAGIVGLDQIISGNGG